MFMIHNNHCPLYLRETSASANNDPVRLCFRSASNLFIVHHGHKPSSETEPFLLPVRRSGTVSRSSSDRRRLLPVLNATSRHISLTLHSITVVTDFYLERCNANFLPADGLWWLRAVRTVTTGRPIGYSAWAHRCRQFL